MASLKEIAILVLASFCVITVQFADVNANGNGAESPPANQEPPVEDGGWAVWSAWTACSKSCEYGVRTRVRCCTLPTYDENRERSCQGNLRETRYCNNHICAIHGNWGAWGGYSQCTKTCGGGTETRTRLCNNPEPQHGGKTCPGSNNDSRSCNSEPCVTVPPPPESTTPEQTTPDPGSGSGSGAGGLSDFFHLGA